MRVAGQLGEPEAGADGGVTSEATGGREGTGRGMLEVGRTSVRPAGGVGMVEPERSGAGRGGPVSALRTRWWVRVLAGAGAFWLVNLFISLTPIAADYRSALSIPYVPMLVEAAVGGLLIAGGMVLVLARFAEHVPGRDPLARALVLSAVALVLFTVLVEVPAKLPSDVTDPGRWLLVAAFINALRLLALGLAIGLASRTRTVQQDRHQEVARRRERS